MASPIPFTPLMRLNNIIGFLRTRLDTINFDIADCHDSGNVEMCKYYMSHLGELEFAIKVLEAKNRELER